MVDDKVYWKMVEAFRDKPGNVRHVAKMVGVDRDTARKAWREGWPRLKRVPIQVLIEREMEEEQALKRTREIAIRTETEAFAAALRGDVRKEALDEYERTSQYLRAASVTATSALAECHQLQKVVRGLMELAPQLVAKVVEGVDDMSPADALRALERLSLLGKQIALTTYAATQQGAKVVEVQRARSADLQQAVISVQATAVEPVDAHEAARLAAELAEAAQEAAAAVEAGPQLSVFKGGAEGAE
jgi:hypothetical protein